MADDDRWRRMWDLFHQARGLTATARRSFLDDACGDDEPLRAEIDALLEADTRAAGFIEPPPRSPVADRAYRADTAGDLPDTIGRYRIRRLIATGGMGVVYEAEQARPHRTVALKVLPTSLRSPSARRRFEYEAQILAHLVHPGIAQIYEAGTHDDGTGLVPFFAMEHVPGAVTILEHARSRGLGIRARLELFAPVCAAVHYGHQRGVIHRDLKPANILVDASGHPKIIDFGVARATDSDMALTTLRTEVGQIVGTLQYMSPEQCETDPHALDVRSDVYALGVVLYELLCGRPPHELAAAAIPEAVRVIREQRPDRPSTIDRALRGDLETIVLKCLEKDRQRRYQSAADLERDIRHFLRREPIEARPPSVLYHLRMHARRNRAVVAALAALLVVLVAAVIVSGALAVKAARAGAVVRREAERTADANAFLRGLLLIGTDPVHGRADMTMAEVLDEAARRLRAVPPEREDVAAAHHLTLAMAYQNLGRYVEAEAHARTAVALTDRVLGPSSPEALYATDRLLDLLLHVGRFAEVHRLAGPALARSRAARGEEDARTLAFTAELGRAALDDGDPREAERLLRRAWDGYARLDGPQGQLTLRAMKGVADALLARDRVEEAEALYRRTLDLARPALGDEHDWVMAWIADLAEAQRRAGQLDEAEVNARRALDLRRRVIGPDHAETLFNMHRLAQILRDRGDGPEAERLWREAIATGERVLADDNYYLAIFRGELGRFLLDGGRPAEARPLLERSHARLNALLGPEHPRTRAVRAALDAAGAAAGPALHAGDDESSERGGR